MHHIIITSFNEPNATIRAVNAILKQKIKEKYEIIIVDPFPEVEKKIKKEIKDKKVKFFLDPGEGKSYALNMLFQEYGSDKKDELFIMTDGDVYVSSNAISKIIEAFKDKSIGCVTGKPTAIDARREKYGYWANLFFAGIDRTRRELSTKRKFFECSGYLFAIRKGVIMDFPLEASEDSIIPYLFWKKGYKIKYVPEAEVYVKNPGNWGDWLVQKVRNVKGHENLNKIVPNRLRTKSFLNETRFGTLFALSYPRNIKEFIWTIEAFFARFYLYFIAFRQIKSKRKYADGWRETETKSTRTLD
jgi:cellulose synthase/poly-beta-1,6-N-acetylglucosamine synthase-like glycosyltransferase